MDINLEDIIEEAMESATPTEVKHEEPVQRFELNPPLINVTTSRFSSAEWYNKMRELSVTIAGLGGIGSYVAFLVGRLNPSVMLIFDDDTVESVNMSGQLYQRNQVGTTKTHATWNNIFAFSNFTNIRTVNERLTEFSNIFPILICGFDNMDARRAAFYNWNAMRKQLFDKKDYLFIDGRLAAEEFQVFCMTGEDEYLINKYEKEWLFSDKEAEATECSYKQTSFCANMIGSVIVNLLVNYVTNLCDPVIPRELPFKTTYNASLMQFTTEL